MSDILQKARQRYESGQFIGSPEGDYNPETLTLVFEKGIQQTPFLSVVVPIHNQESCICENLQSIVDNTTEHTYEIIIVVDACSDATPFHVVKWCKSIVFPENLTYVAAFQSSMPLFETSADNLGFYCSAGEYILEIQADIKIVQKGYNIKLYEPFQHVTNLIGVSGRGCHSLTKREFAGRCIHNIEYPLPPEYPRNLLFIAESCFRGPLMLHRPKLVEMGFLDECNFFLDDSDHDLFVRAFDEKGWVCGYRAVDYISILAHGSTRKERDALNQEHYERKKAIYKKHEGALFYIMGRRIESGLYRDFEIFELPN